MEDISENPPRKTRGRPPKIAEWEWRISRQGDEPRSSRHHYNHVYEARVVSWVMSDPRLEWLSSDSATLMQGKGHRRHTILAELGRIDNAHDREAMALYLCKHQPTTRQAVALIRQYRLGTRPPGSIVQQEDVISRAIAIYQAEHVPLSPDEVSQALHDVAHEILMPRGDAEP